MCVCVCALCVCVCNELCGYLCRPFTEDVLDWMPVDVYIGGIEHGTYVRTYVPRRGYCNVYQQCLAKGKL